MYLNARNAIGAAVLLGAAIATWLLGRPGAGADAASEPARRAQLGYYLADAVLLGTGEDGRIVYRVYARLAEQDPARQGLALQSVRVEYHDAEGVEWRVSAERALAPDDGAHLDLSGNVRLTGQPRHGAEPTVIETERLRLTPEQYLASSAGSVTISGADMRLTARGLKAHLQDDRLELESEVRGQLLP